MLQAVSLPYCTLISALNLSMHADPDVVSVLEAAEGVGRAGHSSFRGARPSPGVTSQAAQSSTRRPSHDHVPWPLVLAVPGASYEKF